MKAWQVTHYGPADEMEFNDIPTPRPGRGEILIRNRAAGCNFFDLLQARGLYQMKLPFPFTIGAEVAGTVERVGAEVENFSPGDRVLAMPRLQGFAEFTISEPGRTFPIPKGLDFVEAACFPIVYQTSYFALTRRGDLKHGEWLLVHAGASGVGMAAIQIGKALGARIIATAGSEAKLAFCRSIGADHALNYRDPAWVEEVKRLTDKRGADVVCDPVGGDVFDLSTKCIAPDGRLLVIGFAGGRIPKIAANRILLKNMAVVGVFMGRHCDEHPKYRRQTQEALNRLYEAGKVRPKVSARFPLSEAPAALAALAERKVIGKVALVME